jgi:hypothetical protein
MMSNQKRYRWLAQPVTKVQRDDGADAYENVGDSIRISERVAEPEDAAIYAVNIGSTTLVNVVDFEAECQQDDIYSVYRCSTAEFVGLCRVTELE